MVQHARGEDLIEESLKSLEDEFGDRFVRIHRNCLVATDRVRRAAAHAGRACSPTLRDAPAAGSQPPLPAGAARAWSSRSEAHDPGTAAHRHPAERARALADRTRGGAPARAHPRPRRRAGADDHARRPDPRPAAGGRSAARACSSRNWRSRCCDGDADARRAFAEGRADDELDAGFVLAAILERDDPFDAFVRQPPRHAR